MYISGLITDFASRLHCLPTGVSDLTTGFYLEASGYLASSGFVMVFSTSQGFISQEIPSGLIDINTSGHWEQEARRQYTQFTSITSGMLIQQLVG